MKNTVVFLTALLVLWIGGCSWYYVCKIRNDCKPAISVIAAEKDQLQSLTTDTLAVPEPEVQAAPPPSHVVEFESGKSTCQITGEDNNYFAMILKYVSDNPGHMVKVTGHADNTGSEETNLKVSKNRAEFIRQQMVNAGIPGTAIETTAKGYLEPAAENSTPEGRSKNRRVVIQIN